MASFNHFSVSKLMSCFKGTKTDKICKLVVAATVWSIWLARNDAIFSNKRVYKDSLQFLICTHIEKWGKETNLLNFGNDPLWKVNHPHWALAFLESYRCNKQCECRIGSRSTCDETIIHGSFCQ